MFLLTTVTLSAQECPTWGNKNRNKVVRQDKDHFTFKVKEKKINTTKDSFKSKPFKRKKRKPQMGLFDRKMF